MDKMDSFFESAKKVCLSETELSACREQMIQKMKGNPVRAADNACLTDDMTHLDPSLIASAHTVRLSAKEAENAGKMLHAFMKDHPVNMAAAVQKHEKKAQRFGWHSFFVMRSTFAAVLVLVLGGGSLSYAAESALPGDPLYGVKIHVNEEVHAALALSAEDKATWETVRAERRIKEAKKLADTGRLTTEKSTALVNAFNTHIAAAHNKIQVIADRGDQEQAERLGKKTEDTLREEASTLGSNEDVAVMLENIQRATDDTVALDSNITGRIAMNAGTAPMMMKMNTETQSDTSVTSESSISSRTFLAFDRQAKDQRDNEGPNGKALLKNVEDKVKDMHEDKPMAAFQTTSMMNMRKTGTGAHSSYSSNGSGSSALSIKSSDASSVDIHISSKSDTPITVDIKSDGSIDVNIDTPNAVPKKDTIKW